MSASPYSRRKWLHETRWGYLSYVDGVMPTSCDCKALPIDLADNVDNARYVYLVTVYTGSRFDAGTSSHVYLTLYGQLLHTCTSLL